jgi:tetratricopeptide (TPR) repeat protein
VQSLTERNLALVRETKQMMLLPVMLGILGDMAYIQGHYERAEDYYRQSFRVTQELGQALFAAVVRRRLGLAVLRQGRVEEARAFLAEALVRTREMGSVRYIAQGVAEWAGLAESCGQPERAARLLGAAEAIWEANDLLLTPFTQFIYERNVAAVRAQLDEDRFATAWAEGRAMTQEQAVDYALEQDSDL